MRAFRLAMFSLIAIVATWRLVSGVATGWSAVWNGVILVIAVAMLCWLAVKEGRRAER